MHAPVLALVFLLAAAPASAQQRPDVKGSQDHPLLSRMPGFYIDRYDVLEFGEETFNQDSIGKPRYTAKGRKTTIRYWNQPDAAHPGNIRIIANYANALGAAGAVVTWKSPYFLHARIERGAKRAWVKVDATDSRSYTLTVLEEQEMKQEVVADASALFRDISDTGHVAVYGIYFDTNRAEIRPESEPALKEIAAMLAGNPALKLHLVGHTDNTGDFAYNMKLSEARAAAVLQALVTQYRIQPSRLRASGAGPLAPVASNRTEEGRARNRRVELVEQ